MSTVTITRHPSVDCFFTHWRSTTLNYLALMNMAIYIPSGSRAPTINQLSRDCGASKILYASINTIKNPTPNVGPSMSARV